MPLPNRRRLSPTLFYSYIASITLVAWLSFPIITRAGEPSQTAEKTYEVKIVRDLRYNDAEDYHQTKHLLDLFLPKGAKDFPVLFFVHGGGWRHGDKNFLGIYSALGTSFAKQGIGTAVINYRLSPEVKHPEHIKDVAKAFAWTEKNIGKYGGRADQVFLCGHSAGGHLVSLLATDESYLKAEGLKTSAIKAVMPISGVYAVPDDFLKSPFARRLFDSAFGEDADARNQAFPMAHVRTGLPPFYILYADGDFPGCDLVSKAFAKAVKDKKGTAEVLEVKKRNHLSIISNLSDDDDPAGKALLSYIRKHSKEADASADKGQNPTPSK
jgi:acetyl esterase/lipase